MPKPTNSAAVGALVREYREAARLTQTHLADRIGASRFWVAAFEKGKPSAELGLALKAIHALGLTLHIGPDRDTRVVETPAAKNMAAEPRAHYNTGLSQLLAQTTLPGAVHSLVAGWPTAAASRRESTATTPRPKRKRKA